ncbi:hypothetical protein E5S66_12405 [Thermomonas fusca]|uniref:Transmembrane protein n=2 Tax=Thermomonas fusca TaxID=215690 RepID=A0A5R9PBZ9_9GAMM|nr:hypothetical protein E5S66_12405 [Thermomonas fusca]
MAMLLPRLRQLAPRLLAVTYAVGALALALSGIGLWRTYCENFGCIGVGIAWFAWAIGYGLLLLAGGFALRLQRRRSRMMLRVGLAVQIVAGVLLLGYWAVQAAL